MHPAKKASSETSTALGENLLDNIAGDVGQAKAAAVVEVGQPLVVDAQQVQHRGVQVVDADAIDDRLVADFVRSRRS